MSAPRVWAPNWYTTHPEGKAAYKAVQATWRRFDRATAYMCRERGVPFDKAAMDAAWAAHEAQIAANCALLRRLDAEWEATR